MSKIKRIASPYSYSNTVMAGEYAFIGLQRGSGDGFTSQLESAFESLRDTLTELGLPLANLVKVNVWLKDINDLPTMEKLFNHYFDEGDYPARMTATTEFIDADCLFMIDGIAYTEL